MIIRVGNGPILPDRNFPVKTNRRGKTEEVFQPPKRRQRRRTARAKAAWQRATRGRRYIAIRPTANNIDALLDWIEKNNAPVRLGNHLTALSELREMSFMARMTNGVMTPWVVSIPNDDETHMWVKLRFS